MSSSRSSAPQPSTPTGEATAVKTDRLGSSDVRVTELGLGTAQFGDLYRPMSSEEASRIIDAAWAGGIRYFDTAPFYGLGLSERRLGHAIRTYERSDYVLSSKVGRIVTGDDTGREFRWDFSAEGVSNSLDQSLSRLGMDHV